MNLKFLFIFIFSFFFSSCVLKPIKSEYTLLSNFSDTIFIDDLKNGKILIYNGAGFSKKMDNTSNVNIWINNRALGQLKAYEYAVINLLPGKYEFKLKHKDLADFNNTQIIDINFDTKIICIKPTIVSNKITIEDNLPLSFHKFKNIAR